MRLTARLLLRADGQEVTADYLARHACVVDSQRAATDGWLEIAE